MINFLNLEYFLVLSQELNFSRAAKQLFISQQSLSAHIARMENELGVTLYERTKPLSLTAAGKHFQLRAQEMLNLREQTLQELSASTIYHADKISLGISYAYSRTLLPKILPSFFQQCPNIQLKLYERNAIDLDEALNNGEIDLIINSPVGKESVHDDSYLRKAAIKARIPYMTTMAAAKATAEGIAYVKKNGSSEVRSLQEFHSLITDK